MRCAVGVELREVGVGGKQPEMGPGPAGDGPRVRVRPHPAAASLHDACGLGEVGFADQCRDMAPGFDGAPEIGWTLQPAAQGVGYAREAVAAAVAWADAAS